MPKLIYTAICSVDGYVEDAQGRFDWAAPDEEVHAAVNDAERPIGTHLYGRRMYETMRYWETVDVASDSPIARDYAEIWRAADKIVYSRTLDAPTSERTRIEREFDPDTVRALVDAAGSDVSIGGATIAGVALSADLVDEVHLYVVPVAVGGGLPALQPNSLVHLELVDHRRFANGTVYSGYRVAGRPPRPAN